MMTDSLKWNEFNNRGANRHLCLNHNDQISFFQLNSNKSKASLAAIFSSLDEIHGQFIYCIQEPHVCHGKLAGVPKGVQCFMDNKETSYNGSRVSHKQPRAAIVSSRDLVAWQLAEFSSRDVCTVMYRAYNDINNTMEDIIVASVYLDIKFNHVR